MIRFIYQDLDFQLRSPEFGNTQSLEFTRINRRTRGGDLIVYRDQSWPLNEILRMTFILLKEIEKSNLLSLIERSLGKNIIFHDHEGFVWSGLITNPETPISEDTQFSSTVVVEFQITDHL